MTRPAGQFEPILPAGSSLYVLLITSILIAIAAVMLIMLDRNERVEAATAVSVNYGPGNYPEILNEDPLAGLDLSKPTEEFQVPKPPFTEGIFPCSECHADLDPDPKVRVLESEHTEIKLNHGGENRWCLDCHDFQDRDKLRLANGTLVPFEESFRLCGQCHGDKYRDWRLGIHGRRTGFWNGSKRYLLCAHCHSPHAPRFQPIKPLAPPVRPDSLGR